MARVCLTGRYALFLSVSTCVLFWCAAAIPPLAAQHREGSEARVLRSEDPALPDVDVIAARRAAGFQLFANRDAAGTGFRLNGNFSYATDNWSPCDAPLTGFCNWLVHPSRNPAVATFHFFEVLYFAGTPPSDWAKIAAIAPAVRNAQGGGWTTLLNFELFNGRLEWGPRDGTLGVLFAGVTSTADGTCRDNTGFGDGLFFQAGLPLLAGSDCPETWGGGLWRGDRPIPRAAWEALFAEQGSAFRFDYWRVPDSLKADGFLGSGFSTYGETSDHYQEILSDYGAVVPGGSGEPEFQGYPLGLVWRFEAFTFDQPGLESVVFRRMTVINRSADVYGAGVDYDSLYLGFNQGHDGAGGVRSSQYHLPHRSMVLFHTGNVQGAGGPCSDSFRVPAGAVSCTGPDERTNYGNGASAIIVLKSPIGDLRNKLFTRRPDGSPCVPGADPFCDPTHPLRGDTITFNHGHMCGFGGCWASTHNVSDKRSFGMISSTEPNVIDGQTLEPSSFTWRTFRSIGYSAVLGRFNKYVPGVQGPPAAAWDWNKDGVPDTLYYDTCGPAGCVVLDWDTMPGGQVNVYGNIGGVISAGPIGLAAGDSLSWYAAFLGERDSASTWASVAAATRHYLNFFPGPAPPPPPRITATQAHSVNEPGARAFPRVTLFFNARAEEWVDPFLTDLADRLEEARAGSATADLLARNPWLVDSLRQRARGNVAAIEIYKSCDGGRTFTADADCVGDPSLDPSGRPLGTGWRFYAQFVPEPATGALPNTFSDGTLMPGRSYLYVINVVSRGATFTLDTPEGPRVRTFAPPLRSAFVLTTDPDYAASVYVPVSGQAGGRAARATFTAVPATATVPFGVEAIDSARTGIYRAVFGNRLVVEVDSSTEDRRILRTRVRVQRIANVAPAGVEAVLGETVFEREDGRVLPVAGTAASETRATIPDGIRVTRVYDDLGFAVATASGAPVFLSVRLAGAAATPDVLIARPAELGFFVTADNRVAGTYDTAAEVQLRGELSRALQPTSADTVPRATADSFMVQWNQQRSANAGLGVGRYRVTWMADPFGLPRGLVLEPTSPAAAQTEFQAALRARPTGGAGLVDPATAELLGVAPVELVAARVPFTVRNETFDREVMVAMQRRDTTLLLGRGADTVRVAVPADEWIPGDVLSFLEDVEQDSTVGGNIVVNAFGEPVRTVRRELTFLAAVLGCDRPRPPACNPVAAASPGETGYVPMHSGDETHFHYYAGFTPGDEYVFEVLAPVSGTAIARVTESDLARIRVVPNPFILYSDYQASFAEPTVVFTNMPPAGTLRIYTVSAQFVQQIRWTPADLRGAGDLHVVLKTREGEPMASGLYVWVLTAPSVLNDPVSVPIRARGKMVVIR